MSTIFTLEKLYKAYKDCQKGKKKTVNALLFEVDREQNLMKLLTELQTGTYEISRHICFIISHPTPREIFAADFRDRIVHHLLCNEIQSLFEETFIFDSYANRKNKGTHRAVRKLRQYILSHGFYIKLDIESFFRSIDRELLYTLVERKLLIIISENFGDKVEFKSVDSALWLAEVLWLCRIIIFNDPTENYTYKGHLHKKELIPKQKSLFYSGGHGLPIGNLTSQFFANVYLNELDHFVTDILGMKRYVRYVDDFVIVHEDQCVLIDLIELINTFLQTTLHLCIHPRKIRLQEVGKGIDFLGYYVKPSHTLVRQKVVKRLKNKLHQVKVGLHIIKDKKAIEDYAQALVPMVNSYYGHFRHANSYHLRKHIYEKHCAETLKTYLFVDKEYSRYVLQETD